ncbi:MAG: asparagine synthetase B, partial [Anaerolineae bacterium]|nr:asparagine synthetase B [Anaerolineae bacterium]
IVWRDKEQFDEGSGTVDLLEPLIKSAAVGLDVEAYRARYPDTKLRSVEECFYHKLLVDGFEKPEVVLKNVARWAERP